MRAWNRKHKPKHWTKPKWHYRYLFGEDVYTLKSRRVKGKHRCVSLETEYLEQSININGR